MPSATADAIAEISPWPCKKSVMYVVHAAASGMSGRVSVYGMMPISVRSSAAQHENTRSQYAAASVP